MVKGLAKFKTRMRKAPQILRDEVVLSMQRTAEKVTKEMRVFNPLSDADIEINWTWGDAPPGSIKIGKVGAREYEKIAITIYARSPSGSGFNAAWFEFGTAERFHKSGKSTGRITAQPFFYPVYRANKSRIKSTIRAAVRRAVKKS